MSKFIKVEESDLTFTMVNIESISNISGNKNQMCVYMILYNGESIVKRFSTEEEFNKFVKELMELVG